MLKRLSAIVLGGTLVSCRPHDPPTRIDAAPAVDPVRPTSCVSTRIVPSAQGSVLEISVQLTRCRVTPVVGDHATSLDGLVPPSAIAGINGGYFDERQKPIGLRRVDGIDRSVAWTTERGGLVAFEGTRVYVGPRALLPFDPDGAVQCHPLLVEANGKRGIVRDDGRRAARTTVCDPGDGTIRFILFLAGAQDGPTLFEAADVLRAPAAQGGFGCVTALNLDGGPSTGAWFVESAIGRSIPPRGSIVDALFVLPR